MSIPQVKAKHDEGSFKRFQWNCARVLQIKTPGKVGQQISRVENRASVPWRNSGNPSLGYGHATFVSSADSWAVSIKFFADSSKFTSRESHEMTVITSQYVKEKKLHPTLNPFGTPYILHPRRLSHSSSSGRPRLRMISTSTKNIHTIIFLRLILILSIESID